ncbi:MAG: hypothetical protein MJ225_02970 [Bacilli bacterium]|nr:hypothetical protein [Bacilli bacterium]
MILLSVSLAEVMWYIFFISAVLLLCFCIVLFILHFVDKDDQNKSDLNNQGKNN